MCNKNTHSKRKQTRKRIPCPHWPLARRLLMGLPTSQRSPRPPLRVLLGGESHGWPMQANPLPPGRFAAPLASSRAENEPLSTRRKHLRRSEGG